MNITIVKNKYINALLLLMLGSATVHMLILFAATLWSGNIYLLNYFNILSISIFIPDFLNSLAGNMFSFIFMAALYMVILKINKA